MPISEVYNEDCMIGIARYPDNYFELAIVDPPYGIGAGKTTFQSGTRKTHNHINKNWDNKTPNLKYFIELFRVSQNQVAWGANYYSNKLPTNRGWIYWHKMVLTDNYSQGELAWTSFDTVIKYFEYKYQGNYLGYRNNITTQTKLKEERRIHPTQKPVQLYKWLLKNYANEGDKILDTHVGSGSSRIACWDGGFDFYGWEIDKDYFDAMEKRFNQHIQQLTLEI